MVNVGGSFGPVVAGHLRAISWDYAFLAAAVSIVVMLLITILFYQEPPREIEGATLGQKLRDIGRRCRTSEVRVLPGPARALLLAAVLGVLQPVRALRGSGRRHRRALPGPGGRLRHGVRRLPVARGRGRGPARDGRDDLAHRLHHHGAAGVRLAASWRSGAPCPRSWSAWRSRPPASSCWATPAGLRRDARLPRDLPVRGGGDDRLAADPGVHHLDRAQGEGGPLHGLELPRGRASAAR